MMYLKFILFLPLDILMKLVGLIAAPLVSLFVSKDGYLPQILYWFQTSDSNMFGYLGDQGFYEQHKSQTGSYVGRWWVCTKWQWRNTSHGFSVYVLGVDDRNLPLETVWETGEGDLKKYYKVVKDVGFDFKGSLKYPFINFRFRWRIGWKLHQDLNHPAQYVFSVSPFKRLE